MSYYTRSWTDNQLKKAVKDANSYRQILKNLGLSESGGSYTNIKKHVERLNLSTDHFTKSGRPSKEIRTTEDYLNNKYDISSNRLRLKLLKEGYFEHKCYNCGRKKWLGMPVPIELEHIDGDSTNNSLDNLTILCLNCHGLTETWRGRKLKKEPKKCSVCSTEISRRAKMCKPCRGKNPGEYQQRKVITKINWPDNKTLRLMVDSSSISDTARRLGVSPTAVSNKLKKS